MIEPNVPKESLEFWNKAINIMNKLKNRMEIIHNQRCETGDLSLQEAYEGYLSEYYKHRRHLILIDPKYVSALCNQALTEARRLEARLGVLWEINEEDQSVQEILEETNCRYIRLLDQAQV